MQYECVVFVYLFVYSVLFFFFFKQKTAYEMRISDWSSDVCSSDLGVVDLGFSSRHVALQAGGHQRYGLRHKFSFAGRAPARRRTVGQVEQVQLETSRVSASAMPSPRKTTMTKATRIRTEEHTSELQSLIRISYAVFCLKKNKNRT